MSEAVTAAPAAPTQAATPSGAPAESPRSHHSANQVRAPTGQFAGGVQAPEEGQPAPTEQQKQTARDRLLGLVDEEGYVTRKVDGQPVRISLERALAEIDMQETGKRRFSELDRRAKELEAREARLKSDPWTVLQELGLDPDEAAYARLQRMVAESELTPEQRAQRELQGERERIRAEREQWEAERQEAELQAEQARLVPMLAKHGPEAMQAAGLPMVPQAVEAFKGYLAEAVQAGQALSPELLRYAAESARDDLRSSARAFISGLDGPALIEELGPEVMAKVRAHAVAEFRAKQAAKGIQPAAPKQVEASGEEPRMLTSREWREAQAKRGL